MLKNLFKKNNEDGITVEGEFPVSIFRKEQNRYLKERVLKIEGINKILNIGANRMDPDKEGSRYIEYFEGKEFYTLDKNKIKDDPNHYNLDVMELDSLDIKFDLVMLMSTLEHIENPFEAVKKIGGIINDGGYVYVTAPFFYPVHKSLEMGYSDYWRFTDDALRFMFRDYEEIWIEAMPSVIKKVADRKLYWEPGKTIAGYCALFRKK